MFLKFCSKSLSCHLVAFLDILGQKDTYFSGRNGQMLITHPLGLLNYVSSSLRLDLKIILTFDVQTSRHFLLNFLPW